MSQNHDPNAAVDFILKNAPTFAKAKADRVYLEEFRKTKKAMLMGQCDAKASNAREEFAYAHPDYGVLLEGLKEAVEKEETLKWHLEAARLRVEIWKTRTYTERKQENTTK